MKRRVSSLGALALALGIASACDQTLSPTRETSADAGVAPTPADASTTLDASDSTTTPAALHANAGAARYALVGEDVVLDGSASTGAVKYQWDFGDGRREGPRTDAIAHVAYPAPGRYQAVLTVWDESGAKEATSVLVSVTHPATFARSESSTVLVMPDLARIAAVSTDSDEVVFFADASGNHAELARFSVADEPRTIARFGSFVAVACQGADVVELVPASGSGARVSIPLPYGSRPYGVATSNGDLFVSLAGTGQLVQIHMNASTPSVVRTIDGLFDARAVSALPQGRVAVTRWRSPDDHGVVSVVDGLSGSSVSVSTVALAYDPQLASDTEIGGVPSYLNQVAVSPTGREAAIPSLQANITDGLYRNGRALRFETTIRAIVSFVDLGTMTEPFSRRKQFDNRGLSGAATYSSHGDYLFVAMPGNRTIERFDVLSEVLSGSVSDVGYAPDGVTLSADDQLLYVNATLSRELVVYDVASFDTPASPRARLSLVKSEPLDATVLAGKRLFNDSADPRLSKDGYLACAHCHLEGDSDRRVWDFSDRGEGLRNTTSLFGRAGTGDGPLHWSANFDEVQDFEHDIRDAFEGYGLMTNADFHTGTRDQKLGDPKAGVSSDLDALAAYVASLGSVPRSPARSGDGVLSAAATRGQTVFANAGCATCHSGARFTDSKWLSPGVPNLHDVGTLGPGSGNRLGGTLTGIDTPTLLGVFATPPYLHDGSAATLRAVVTTRNAGSAHGSTSTLTSSQIDDLVEYLSSL